MTNMNIGAYRYSKRDVTDLYRTQTQPEDDMTRFHSVLSQLCSSHFIPSMFAPISSYVSGTGAIVLSHPPLSEPLHNRLKFSVLGYSGRNLVVYLDL